MTSPDTDWVNPVDFQETTPTFSRPPIYEGDTSGIEEIMCGKWTYVVRHKKRSTGDVDVFTLCRYPNPFYKLLDDR